MSVDGKQVFLPVLSGIALLVTLAFPMTAKAQFEVDLPAVEAEGDGAVMPPVMPPAAVEVDLPAVEAEVEAAVEPPDMAPAPVEPETVPAAAEITDPAPVPAPVLPDDALLMTGDGTAMDLISINVVNVPLLDVVQMFTRIPGVNIIADPATLTGMVTVSLSGIMWQPALRSILAMHNMTMTEKEIGTDVFVILPQPADAPPQLVSQAFNLKFSTVADVTPVIRPMLIEQASLSEFPSRNLVVVRSTKENLAQVEKLLETIDLPTKQVSVETRFMELTDEASEHLGIRWDSLAGWGATLGLGPFTWNREAVRRNDRENRTVLEDVHSHSDTRNRTWEGETYTPSRAIEAVNEHSETRLESDIANFSRTLSDRQASVLEMDSFQAVLSALKMTDGVSVISNPKLIVANGATNAFFRVGEREPIIKTSTQRGTEAAPGDLLTSELDTKISTEYIEGGFLRTGIELQVIPVVKTDDLIEATIEPRLIRKVDEKTVAGNSWPIIDVKEIKTQFTLRSGQTVAIGGLTDSREGKQTSKIPLLGDIPLIGKYLFSHTETVQEQFEIIIFVTLSLATPENITHDEGIPRDATLVHQRLLREREAAE